ncbi:terpenoid cyclases/Protein prenyltransferase [Eremomyces bilateralis CBS 781.70]|uniref:Terpenoid cyclases/Protein prenyltransferase n=1 Tax=Eremomyces bilateralis CBS 781.70 TaxID=1392243 RepID=A0A6G1GBV2_9PEZI|nr:terpenoid cyclases/Protein prenyltransferase [Eremomyces bilateralis CBS 781.70]KAF1815567.1 terpenoid cyclases/Protein prenyltransferase [Eremomyces bilateralis CBS 781.70]
MCIRWMLRGIGGREEMEEVDVDVEGLERCIAGCQTYDGGIADEPFHEPHAGYTHCSISALALLYRPQEPPPDTPQQIDSTDIDLFAKVLDVDSAIRWLVSRQTSDIYLHNPDDSSGDEEDAPVKPLESLQTSERPTYAGFNGRTNKIADTCYAFWVLGSLTILGRDDLIDAECVRSYLLSKTQHRIGGFGKTPGDTPDPYHSFLGLAALSLLGEEGLKPLDAAVCLSGNAVGWIQGLHKITR